MEHINAALQNPRGRPDGMVSPDEDSGAFVQSWTGEIVRSLIRSPELCRRYERWMTLVKTKMPRLNELLDGEQAGVSDNTMLLYRVPGDFVFVHQGEAAVQLIGANLTGTLLSLRATAAARGVAKVYTKSVAVGDPYYIRHVASVTSNQHFLVEQIVLPAAADERGDVEFVLVYSAPLDDKSEMLSAIFERSQIGMVAAAATHDDSGRLQNGRILLVNAAARKILKIPDAGAALQTVRDLGPWFRDGALWTKLDVVKRDKRTDINFLEQSSGKNYRVTVETVDNFVLFSIFDISGLR